MSRAVCDWHIHLMLRKSAARRSLFFVLAALSFTSFLFYLSIQESDLTSIKHEEKAFERRSSASLLERLHTSGKHSAPWLLTRPSADSARIQHGGDGTSLSQRLSVHGVISNQSIPPECICSSGSGQTYDFCYHLPERKAIYGQRFSCEHLSKIDSLGLLDTSTLKFIGTEIPSIPIFVTAFSYNHAHEATNLAAAIDHYFEKKRLIAYDLGGVITDSFKKYKFMEFRRFNYAEYPRYVQDLQTFRWKPLIIAETLKEYGAIWYMDSSVVVKKGNLSHVYELIRCRKYVSKRPPLKSSKERDKREAETPHEDGWDIKQWKENVAECRKAAYLMHGYTGHGIYTATSTAIYKFFPTNFTEIRKPKAKMYEAGMVFAVRTKDTVENILKWYVLCALEQGCMAGNGKERIGCYFETDRFGAPPNCHRFDQSVVNVLAANAYWYDRHYYVSEIVDFFNIVRQ